MSILTYSAKLYDKCDVRIIPLRFFAHYEITLGYKDTTTCCDIRLAIWGKNKPFEIYTLTL